MLSSIVERRDRIPERVELLSAEELMASLLYLRSQYGHAELARVGSVLPVLLQTTRLGPRLW